MKVQCKEIQAFKQVFDLMFPRAFSAKSASPRSAISTAFYPSSDGTVLVAYDSCRSLARVVSARPCDESLACSCHWLEEFAGDEGYVDVSTRRDLVDFSRISDNQSRVLSLIAEEPSTGWASPVMGAIDGGFIDALIDSARLGVKKSGEVRWQSIALDGRRGTITTESDYEVLSHSAFKFPWQQSVNLGVTGVAPFLRIDERDQVSCGVLGREIFITAGPWRLRLPLDAMGLAINSDSVKKELGRVTNRVQMDSEDLDFLADHLQSYSEEYLAAQWVTLRLGDRVEVEIVNTGGPTSKRLTLTRSSQRGKPVAIPLKAWQLLRAASLELTRWHWHSNSRRIACADERVLYVCESIALPFDFTLPADAVEIDSVSGSPALV